MLATMMTSIVKATLPDSSTRGRNGLMRSMPIS
jgi:hypothetical protein